MAGSEAGTLLETRGGEGDATGPRTNDGVAALKPRRWVVSFRSVAVVLLGGVTVLALGVSVLWVWSFQWLRGGRHELETRQYHAAEKSLNAFLRWHPRNSEAHFLLGGTYGQLHNWEQAMRQFQQVAPDAPQAMEAVWRIGDAAMMLNRAGDTERALRRSIEMDPASLEARRGLIALYRWQDRELDAEPLVWEAYELTPIEERALLMAEWFRFHFAQSPVADTFRRLSAFLTAQPDDAETAIALGLWSVRQRQLGEARVLLDKVFAQFPDLVDARAGWATCLLELGEWDDLQRVLNEWPQAQQDVRYWRLKGIALQEFSSEYSAALDCLRRWVAHYPDDWQVRFRISACLRQIGNTEAAEAEAARAEQLKRIVRYEDVDEILTTTLKNLHRPEQRHRMGEFYRAAGCEREAKVWFELTLLLDPAFEPSRAALQEAQHDSSK